MADIFVSYSSEDREAVASLVKSLEMQSWTVWWDREISPGAGFADEIDREIQEASCVVVVWSQRSIESRWVKSEALEAMERDILVPVKLEDVRVPVAFKQVQMVDLRGWPEPERDDQYPSLMKAIAALVGANSEELEVVNDVPSIAVLPFKCLSRDPDHEFLADGITEDIIISLSHVDDLFVSAQASSFVLKGSNASRPEQARKLGVRYILEGSLRPMGSKIRVSAQLIDAERGDSLWAKQFNQPVDEFFDLQDEVVTDIVNAMGWTVQSAEVERSRQLPKEELDARQITSRLLSIEYGNDLGVEEFWRQQFADVDLALLKAPNYAPALAAKAMLLAGGASNMYSSDIPGDRAQALELGKKALQLSPRSAWVKSLVGHAYGLAGFYDDAIATLEHAQELAPNIPVALASLGYAYIMSRKDAAYGVTLVKDAIRRDPLYPNLHIYYFWQAMGEATLGNYDEAIESIRHSIRRSPLYPWSWIDLAVWLSRTGQIEEARKAAVQAKLIHPGLDLARIRESTEIASGARVANRTVDLLSSVWE